MKFSTLPADEKERLQALRNQRILDTDNDQDFNDIVSLASQLCDSPISLITLLDEHRQWFKAKIGIDLNETSRKVSFCAHAIHQDDVMVVLDATIDERFHDNPLVTGDPNISFYAGMPLITDGGYKLGTLCVIDVKPKELSPQQLSGLRILGKQVVNLIKLRLKMLDLNQEVETKKVEISDIFERISEGVIVLDKNWRYTYANKYAGTLVHRDPASLLGKNVWEEFPQAVGSATYNAFQRAMIEQCYISHVDHYEPLKLWQENRIYPTQDGIVVFIKDISEAKEAEAQLSKEKETAVSFINSLPGVFYLYDSNGKFIRWNRNFEKVTGYTEDEIKNMHPSQLFEEGEERNRVVERISEVFVNGFAEVEANFLLKDRRKIPYYFNGWKIEYDNKPCLIGVGLDISDRKKAEEKLRTSENKLRAFFRSTPDPSVLVGANDELLAFNPAANDLAQSTYHQPLQEGQLLTEIFPVDLRPTVSMYAGRALKGETTQGEISVPNKNTDEKIWWMYVFMPAYDSEGNIFGVVVTSTNINKIKNAELTLRQQFKELQKTNYELDRFVYSASHDLRAPLSSILGLLNIAEGEALTPAMTTYFGMFRQSITKLDGFIKDILDYSRNARTEIEYEQIDFLRLLKETQNTFKLMPGAERLKTTIAINDHVPFYSDRLRLQSILSNLMSNAIKYQDYKKNSSYVNIQITSTEEKAVIQFRDNGMGIEAKYLDKIFDMFYRASENSHGAGLGLYIAKETTDKLDGQISVNSSLGVSTTFEIELPNRVQVGSKQREV
jgi:PAS domain S-box-containing protein